MVQTDPPRSPKEVLPTMYDLKSEDPEEPGLPDEFHDLQIAGYWLRWSNQNQNWIPTPTEQIEQERLRTEQERQKVEELEALLQRYREQYGDLS